MSQERVSNPRVPAVGLSNSKGPIERPIGFWRFLVWYFIALTPIAAWVIVVSNSTIVRAERAFSARQYQVAVTLATRQLRDDQTSNRALMVAASAFAAMQDHSTARGYFSRVSADGASLFGLAQRELGRIAILAGQASAAEEHLRAALGVAPDDRGTLDQLIFLLTLEGRSQESRALALTAIRSGAATSNYLLVAITHKPNLDVDIKFANHCLSVIPDDPLPRLTLAKNAWRDNRPDEARRQLKLVLDRHPELLEAHALLGEVLVETGTSDEFRRACDRLPSTADRHPDIWLNRGIWAENHGQQEAAARCFWESVRLEPNLPNANYRLSQALVRLHQTDSARIFATRAEKITTLLLETNSFFKTVDRKMLPSIVRQLEDLGRDWEAAGWCEVAGEKFGQRTDWARAAQLRLHRRLMTSNTFTSPASDPSREIDLSRYPIPTFENSDRVTPPPSRAEESQSQIAFEDDARRVGLDFTYLNGEPGGELETMIEMNGGGVAVLDYDGDHWPDLYLTQGGRLPPAQFDPLQHDRLFRNRGGADDDTSPHAFEDVTEAAGIRDFGYGQGVTVGDFDNDGFPDLYVGNIGRNQFYRNNGDGTFSDVTVATGTQAGGWTSSGVLADFNRDGLPDLYVVTYLGGETPFVPCKKRSDKRCAPLAYPAESDRFYLNLGDGRFRDLSETCGLAAPDGRGLGVVAADFDGSGRLSLFVANDMSANFFFHNQTSSSDAPKFEEQAMLSGLAFDHAGRIQACMGVAAGDYNGDGRLDLFVTNFYRESNDLFTQQADGLFRDLSREAKLYDPSFLQLGWGTQFLDADLDGYPDLIVTNGHVHDPVEPEIPYQMSPQFFRNRGDSTFTEIPGRQLGAFFEQKWLGRPLARLDWNRDGLDDVCISHLNQPVALLTNRSDRIGRFIAFRCVAVDSARDAIGTKILVTAEGRICTQQLTAGDGFQASNERRLVFGVKNDEKMGSVDVEVLWPSGSRQSFPNLNLDHDWLMIEHRRPIELISHPRQ